MNEIVVINDGSIEAFSVAVFALKLAKANNANILLANVVKQSEIKAKGLMQLASTGRYLKDEYHGEDKEDSLKDYLNDLALSLGFVINITELDASRFDENKLCDYINARQVSLAIKPVSNMGYIKTNRLNIQKILNKIQCPALFIPPAAEINMPQRMVYLTDLRYCQQRIIEYLQKFNNNNSSILLAHICENGLVDLDKNYATTLFGDIANNIANKLGLVFAHIRQRDMVKSVDVLVNTMKADMLICVKRQLNNEEQIWNKITTRLPDFITVPLLVFPY